MPNLLDQDVHVTEPRFALQLSGTKSRMPSTCKLLEASRNGSVSVEADLELRMVAAFMEKICKSSIKLRDNICIFIVLDSVLTDGCTELNLCAKEQLSNHWYVPDKTFDCDLGVILYYPLAHQYFLS